MQLRALPLSRRVIVMVSLVLIVLLLVAGLSLGGWILYHYLREPTVILLGEANQTVEAFSSYEDPGISLKLGKKTIKGDWEVHGKPDTTTPATYEMEYTVYWHFRKIHVKRTVNVVDTTPPTLTLMGEREMTLGSLSQFQEPGYVAKDR